MFDPLDTIGPIWTPGPVVRDHPLNQVRVAWWLTVPGLDGGRQWYDLMGLRHGTLTNMTTSASGWRGTTRPGGSGHLLFDGSDDTVAVGTMSLNATHTMAAWVNCSNVGASFPVAVGGNGDFEIRLNVATGKPEYQANSAATSATALTQGQWYRLVGTSDGTNVNIYVNGILKASTAQVTTTQNRTIVIGGRSASLFWPGSLDDVSIWGRALSAADVQSDYDISRRGYPGALRRWPGIGAAMMAPASTYPGAFVGGLADHAPPNYTF